jgi:hypothetical protein
MAGTIVMQKGDTQYVNFFVKIDDAPAYLSGEKFQLKDSAGVLKADWTIADNPDTFIRVEAGKYLVKINSNSTGTAALNLPAGTYYMIFSGQDSQGFPQVYTRSLMVKEYVT